MTLPSPRASDGHYHLHVHTISKLKGHSIQAAAAYRRAELFRAEPQPLEQSVTQAAAYQRAQELGNNGRVFDYRRKIGVAWTGIIAPDCTPKELLDAETLWNTVERIESRKNARLAREMIIALPHQVDLNIHIAMLRAFITAHLTARGMIADVAIHKPPVEHGGDPRNWHAHVLLTDRPITAEGFAAKKDRMWNAKENVTLWRKAWADTHNATMEHLGLPHRIDHRSLEAQRQDALQRGDTIAALDLDRTPQIHVGKAAYGRHPSRTIYRERRELNRAILTANKDRAYRYKERIAAAVAHADNAAYIEARHNAVLRDTWRPEPASLDDLKAAYGRPAPATAVGRLKALAFDGDVTRRALALSRPYRHPWFASGHREDAPSLIGLLLPMVKSTGPGHPVFTVTAKDLAFCFYGLGFISRRELQASLENIAQEEQRLFADRIAKKPELRPPAPLPKSKPPRMPTPHADRLKRLQRAAVVPQSIYMKRLAQLNAYTDRRQANTQRRFHLLGPTRPGRRLQMAAPPTS